jgi:hypothetical protein
MAGRWFGWSGAAVAATAAVLPLVAEPKSTACLRWRCSPGPDLTGWCDWPGGSAHLDWLGSPRRPHWAHLPCLSGRPACCQGAGQPARQSTGAGRRARRPKPGRRLGALPAGEPPGIRRRVCRRVRRARTDPVTHTPGRNALLIDDLPTADFRAALGTATRIWVVWSPPPGSRYASPVPIANRDVLRTDPRFTQAATWRFGHTRLILYAHR